MLRIALLRAWVFEGKNYLQGRGLSRGGEAARKCRPPPTSRGGGPRRSGAASREPRGRSGGGRGIDRGAKREKRAERLSLRRRRGRSERSRAEARPEGAGQGPPSGGRRSEAKGAKPSKGTQQRTGRPAERQAERTPRANAHKKENRRGLHNKPVMFSEARERRKPRVAQGALCDAPRRATPAKPSRGA